MTPPAPLAIFVSLSHTLHTPLCVLSVPFSLAIATGQMRWSRLSSGCKQWAVVSTSFVEARSAMLALLGSLDHVWTVLRANTHMWSCGCESFVISVWFGGPPILQTRRILYVVSALSHIPASSLDCFLLFCCSAKQNTLFFFFNGWTTALHSLSLCNKT